MQLKICLYPLLVILISCSTPVRKTSMEETGHTLIFDTRLSATGTKSCAGCHNPQFAFTDGYKRTLGVFADISNRNTPGLLNMGSNQFLNWADTIHSLEQQMERPLFDQHMPEMGLKKDDPSVLNSLKADELYLEIFTRLFPGQPDPVNWINIKKCIASFVLSLNSRKAPYDLYKLGDTLAVNEISLKGETLFFSEKLKCSHCHVPPDFGANPDWPLEKQFANIGLYNLAGGSYANQDNGLYQITRNENDIGRFRIPSLRNLSFTAPYFHDGSAETLEDALSVFESGGRKILKGEWKGDGRKNVHKNNLISGYSITDEERLQLVHFLQSLDDSSILTNPLFRDPFQNKLN